MNESIWRTSTKLTLLRESTKKINVFEFNSQSENNWEPVVLVHYMAAIGNRGIVRITHDRWHCGI